MFKIILNKDLTITIIGTILGTLLGILLTKLFRKFFSSGIIEMIDRLERKGLPSDVIYKQIMKEISRL